jgi:hypothetical protein
MIGCLVCGTYHIQHPSGLRYWSRGEALQGMVIFSLGNSSRMRIAAGLTLIQAFSQ